LLRVSVNTVYTLEHFEFGQFFVGTEKIQFQHNTMVYVHLFLFIEMLL